MAMNITCPLCQSTFMVQDAIVDAEAVDSVEDEPRAEPSGGPFDDGIVMAADADDPSHTIQQRIVSALLLRSLDECRPSVVGNIAAVITVALLVPLAAGAGFLIVLAMYYPLALGNRLIGGSDGGLLYLLPAGFLLLVSTFKKMSQDDKIETARKGDTVTSLKLGRLHDTFAGGIVGIPVLAGLLLGWQAGLLYRAPIPCDLAFAPTAGEAWLLTLDTVSAGSLGSILDKFGAGIPQRESSVWSDTLFSIFRAAYGGCGALLGYQLYQRWKLRHLFDDLPEPFAGSDDLTHWVDDLCRSEKAYARALFDEIMFLSLAAMYVEGRWDEARGLARQFPWMRITPDVRRLFIDRNGDSVFPPG